MKQRRKRAITLQGAIEKSPIIIGQQHNNFALWGYQYCFYRLYFFVNQNLVLYNDVYKHFLLMYNGKKQNLISIKNDENMPKAFLAIYNVYLHSKIRYQNQISNHHIPILSTLQLKIMALQPHPSLEKKLKRLFSDHFWFGLNV